MITPKDVTVHTPDFSQLNKRSMSSPAKLDQISAVSDLRDRLSIHRTSPTFQAVIFSRCRFLEERWGCTKIPYTKRHKHAHTHTDIMALTLPVSLFSPGSGR